MLFGMFFWGNELCIAEGRICIPSFMCKVLDR